jgi:hypothetical protein
MNDMISISTKFTNDRDLDETGNTNYTYSAHLFNRVFVELGDRRLETFPVDRTSAYNRRNLS